MSPVFSEEKEPRSSSLETGHTFNQGVAGTENYRVGVRRIRQDLFRGLTSNGLVVNTKEFSWENSISKIMDSLRATKEQEAIERVSKLAKGEATELEGMEAGQQAVAETDREFEDNKLIFNTLQKFKDEISIIDGEVPDELKQVPQVAGADWYFLLEGRSVQDYKKGIFDELRARGAMVDDLVLKDEGLVKSYREKNFVGWRVEIKGVKCVFIFNSEEEGAPATEAKPVDEKAKESVEAEEKKAA